MNILPLILILTLMLSILTVEKLEKFKNQTIAQKQYQVFLQESERKVFNQRQKTLFGQYQRNIKQLSFRYFVKKEARDGHPREAAQYRLSMIELMKILYGEASFFKKLAQKRPSFLEEMLNLVERAADAAPEKLIKQVGDIARLNLSDPEIQGDPELHEAFYHMLKGTVSRESKKKLEEEEPENQEKAYVSLFEYINFNGADKIATIEVQKAPREILLALFENEEVVKSIILRRNELANNKDNGSPETFKEEFSQKRRVGIDDTLLNFTISTSSKSEYN